jgi:hypothetical protein
MALRFGCYRWQDLGGSNDAAPGAPSSKSR